MATYKVIQDIEAEDKFVGPLTLKQFIFAAIFVVSGYISFIFITKHVWFLALPLFPLMVATGFLAFPWGRDQPTETWLLAKITFYLKPHRRVWDQSGMEELVTITAPRKPEAEFVGNNLSQTEVRSRLHALADTIDSRGWAVKNVNVNLYAQPGYGVTADTSDRLVDASTLPQQVSGVDIHAADDMLDETSNPTAQKLDQMVAESEAARKQQMRDTVNQARTEAKNPENSTTQPPEAKKSQHFWFMDEPAPKAPIPAGYTTFTTQTLEPGTVSQSPAGSNELSPEEKALLDKVHKELSEPQPAKYGHMRVIKPLAEQKKEAEARAAEVTAKKAAVPPVTRTPAPDILALAVNNVQSVASLAKEAAKNREEPDEVVINLH